MTEKTVPQNKSGDSTRAARGLKDGPPIDQNSATLINFPRPVTVEAPSPAAETLPVAPPPQDPQQVPSSETHAGLGDPTLAPTGPPNAGETPPDPSVAATLAFIPQNLTERAIPSQPGATPAGHDAVTQEFRRAPFEDAATTLRGQGYDSATRAFHQAAFAPAQDATLGGNDGATQAFHQQAMEQAPKAIATGASFGHYELIEPIAKGGMGIVYKARQRNLNRIVAIKMILAGQFADQSDIDRFYAEAEAAAALSHPNIVAIHEIGQVQGQHFFSMDYIEGKSLSGLIQENTVPPRRAAEFVRTIAETMQFAHDSGVVHRDLKPANILLDKRQRPLITDFGLAKQVSNTSQLTMAGSIVGTPSYMPPEQAAGRIEEVGPWSDLYSLGAILYELLTGRPPFRAATPFETIRQVLEQEPPSPRLLNPALPRDLETIALKCLQKERTRRYDSAQELADELGRFLRGEPIHARPISKIHRFWRLCKRNPVTSSAIASAVFALVAATIISFGFYLKATHSLAQEKIAKAKAVSKHKKAMQAIDDLFTIVSENSLLNQPGTQPVRRELLEKARNYYEDFSKEDPDDPEIAIELAGANFRMGRIAVMLGSLGDAIQPLNSARQMQDRLVKEKPDDAERMKALSATLTQLGQIGVRTKNYEAASRDYADAVEIRKQLAAAFPNDDEYQRLWANAHMNLGLVLFNRAQINQSNEADFKKYMSGARQEYQTAQKIREDWLAGHEDSRLIRRDLGKGYYNLGDLAWLETRDSDAIAHFKRAVDEFEKLLQDEPNDLDNQGLVATCRRLLGDLYNFTNEPAQSRQWYQSALEGLEKLAKENPEVTDYRRQQASVLLNLFKLEKQVKKPVEARQALQKARDIYAPLAEEYPEIPAYQEDLAIALRELAKEDFAAGDEKSAKENLEQAKSRFADLVNRFPSEDKYRTRLKETEEIVLAKPPEQPTQPATSPSP